MRWIVVTLAILLAGPASAVVVHCADGRVFIEDRPEAAPCGEPCPRWTVSPGEGDVMHAHCDTGSPAQSEGADLASTVDAAAPGLVLIFLSVALYFLPGMVASARRHHNAGAIWILNVLLGWTGLGWIAALIWAATAVRRSEA